MHVYDYVSACVRANCSILFLLYQRTSRFIGTLLSVPWILISIGARTLTTWSATVKQQMLFNGLSDFRVIRLCYQLKWKSTKWSFRFYIECLDVHICNVDLCAVRYIVYAETVWNYIYDVRLPGKSCLLKRETQSSMIREFITNVRYISFM